MNRRIAKLRKCADSEVSSLFGGARDNTCETPNLLEMA